MALVVGDLEAGESGRQVWCHVKDGGPGCVGHEPALVETLSTVVSRACDGEILADFYGADRYVHAYAFMTAYRTSVAAGEVA